MDLADRLGKCHASAVHDVLREMGHGNCVLPPTIRPLEPGQRLAGEVYTQLGQKDYAAELAALRDAKPDAVFFFLPGGMGISFLKQYSQAGLAGEIPVFGPAFSFDQTILGAVGDAALGVINSSQWNKDLDNAANKAFVEGFQARYGRLPSLYASQGYDAARLIGSARRWRSR